MSAATVVPTKVYIRPGQQVRRLKLTPDTSFEQFKSTILKAYESSVYSHNVEYETQFLYLDNEDDWISVNSEQEFADALSYYESGIFRVKVIIAEKKRLQQRQQQHQRPHGSCVFRLQPNPDIVLNQCHRLASDVIGSVFKPQTQQQQPVSQQPEQKSKASSSDPLVNLIDNVLDNLLKPEENNTTGNTSSTSNNNATRSSVPSDPISGLLQGIFGSLNQSSATSSESQTPVINLNNLIQQATGSTNGSSDPVSGLLNGFFDMLEQTTKRSESTSESKPQQQSEPQEQVQQPTSVQVPVQQQQQPQQQPEPVTQKTETTPEVVNNEPKEQPIQHEEEQLHEPSVVQQQPFEQELQSLASMGFSNNLLNQHLLKHHKGDLVKVVSQLLELTN